IRIQMVRFKILQFLAVFHDSATDCTTVTLIALYQWYCEKNDASAWVCKENNLFDHAQQIFSLMPDAYFIYLCRDGRDYACSIKRVPSHDQHIFFIAQEWLAEQEKSLRIYQEVSPIRRIFLLRYEDLITDPEKQLSDLCAFLEIDYQPGMLDYYADEGTKQDAQKTAYWANLARPVMKENRAKFYNQLSKSEIKLFERIAGSMLRVLGYPLVFPQNPAAIKPWQKVSYWIQNKIAIRKQRSELLKEPGRAARTHVLQQMQARSQHIQNAYLQPLSYQPHINDED
ncbi:MAG: sulfotransferase, partial [Anaerolineales bacterium]|nr:sulfotransferase [Anaerolineales bacterium]